MKSYFKHKTVQYVSTVLQYKIRNDAELIKHYYYLPGLLKKHLVVIVSLTVWALQNIGIFYLIVNNRSKFT